MVVRALRPPTPNDYWRGQVWPRRRGLLTDPVLWIAAALGVACTVATPRLPVAHVTISTVAGFILAYAALSFGACVTGAVLALTFPDESLRRQWTTERNAAGFSHYSEIIFVFTWAGIAQILVVIEAVCCFILGGNLIIWPPSPSISHVGLLVAAYVFGFYAILELFTVLFTVSQVGVVTDKQS